MRRKHKTPSRYYAGSLRSKYAIREERKQAKAERAKYDNDPANHNFYHSDFWKSLHKQVIERDQGICQYCGATGTQADHIYPRSKGGKDAMENLVCACKGCNKRAGARIFTSFESKRRWLVKVRHVEGVIEPASGTLRDKLRARRLAEATAS